MLRVNKHYINPDTDFDWDAFIEEKLGVGLYTGKDIDMGMSLEILHMTHLRLLTILLI